MLALIRSVATTIVSISILVSVVPGHTLSQTPAPSQEPSDVIRVNTELVQTDVTVFDKEGRFKHDLRVEDFELRINGKLKPISFFERITSGSGNEEAQLSAARGSGPSRGAKGTPTPLDRGRTVFFYIDDMHVDLAAAQSIRKVVNRFIDAEMSQNDEVAITSASGQIGFLQQLTSNKAVLRRALERFTPRPYSVQDMQRPTMTEYQALRIESFDRDVLDFFVEATLRENPGLTRQSVENMVQGRANLILRQAAHISKNSLIGLENLVRSATRLPGRKLLFFLSNGFFVSDRNSDLRSRLQKITSAAARSGVVIYSMDTRGLVATFMDASVDAPMDPSFRLRGSEAGELTASQDGMHALAADTGGRSIFNTNALEPGLKQALKETAVYYLLAWKPDDEKTATSKFRRIEVKLINKPGLTARVRRGFFDIEPPAEVAADKNNQKPAEKVQPVKLWDVIGAPAPTRTVPFSLNLIFTDIPQKGALLSAAMQVPSEFLTFNLVDGKLKSVIELAGGVLNDKGQLGSKLNQTLTIVAPPANSSLPPPKDFKYTFPVYLAPGLYQARFGVRDIATGKTGSAYDWIEIPALTSGQVALSSLHIGERVPGPVTNASIGGSAPADEVGLSIDHRFRSSSYLRFLVFVYNAARGPDSKPDAAIQVQLLRDNQPVLTTPLKKVATDDIQDLNRIPYAAEIALNNVVPGRYLLKINVVDRVSKRSASQEAHIDIE